MFGWGFFDPLYYLILAPAILLMLWAQARVRGTYARGMQYPAPLSGASAARHILDRAGLYDVQIEQTQGFLSDHYDPRARVLRLSPEVYDSRTASAVGIAAHEAGHALQHAAHYAPLVVRNFAVPAATWGPTLSIILLMIGALMASPMLINLGLLAFAGLLVFQVVNLPVEFDASNRAKRLLSDLNIVDADGAAMVRSVLNAAGWTYVAGMLQTLLTLIYYVIRFGGIGRNDD